MSTRATLHFHGTEPWEAEVIVYRHFDGYPETEHGVIKALEDFFAAYEAENGHGPAWVTSGKLAALFIVSEYKAERVVEIMGDDPGDIEYRYHIYSGYDREFFGILEGSQSRPERPKLAYEERARYNDQLNQPAWIDRTSRIERITAEASA